MATISFTREMKLNKKETDQLFKILETESPNNYRVSTPAAREATREDIIKVLKNKNK